MSAQVKERPTQVKLNEAGFAESYICPNCKGKGKAPHACPFSADIHGDSETLCTCCEVCEDECAMEI